MGEFGRSGISPVREGEELEVTIEAVGAKGDGIAKKNGFVLFVPNTKEGDTVKIRITKVFRKVGFAEVVGAAEQKAEEPSEEAGEEEAEEEPAKEEQPEEEAEPSEEAKEPEEPEAKDTEDFGEEEEK